MEQFESERPVSGMLISLLGARFRPMSDIHLPKLGAAKQSLVLACWFGVICFDAGRWQPDGDKVAAARSLRRMPAFEVWCRAWANRGLTGRV